MTIESKALVISEELKKIDMVCKFACVRYELMNGSVISLKNTNIAYAKPHILKVRTIYSLISAKMFILTI